MIDDLSAFIGESEGFKKAIEEIEESLDPKFSVDETHLDPEDGEEVFERLGSAIEELMDLVEKPDEISGDALAAAQAGIDDLVAAARFLAATLLDETSGVQATDPERQGKVDEQLAKAQEELDKGDAEAEAGNYDEAVDHYKEAWEHTGEAAMEAAGDQEDDEEDEEEDDDDDDDDEDDDD